MLILPNNQILLQERECKAVPTSDCQGCTACPQERRTGMLHDASRTESVAEIRDVNLPVHCVFRSKTAPDAVDDFCIVAGIG